MPEAITYLSANTTPSAGPTTVAEPVVAYLVSATMMAQAPSVERVHAIRAGLPAQSLVEMAQALTMPRDRLYATLRFPRATVERKIRNGESLSPEQTERVIGLSRLIGQVATMVAQSGNPEGFDAPRWVGAWLDRPLPALGGGKPGDYMDTMEGQGLVARLLDQSLTGVYA